MINKQIYKLSAVALSASLLFACSNQGTTEENTVNAAAQEEILTQVESTVNYAEDDEYSVPENAETIALNGTSADFDSSAAVIFQDNTLTIKAGGTYVIEGTLDAGQIIVDSEDKKTVRLVLDGVEINSSDTSAINVVSAEKTVISLEEGTENVLSDGQQYIYEDSETDEPNAAIFSKDDLTINGSGSLVVNGNFNNGITSKDSLKITGGDIEITAVDDGLMGRDLVAVKDGTIDIEAGGDGIKSSNDEDQTKGNIAVEGGTFTIVSGNDGVQSAASLYVADGEFTISAGAGSSGAANSTAETESDSTKGLKAVTNIAVSGGTFDIDSLDDAVHSDGDLLIGGGEWLVSTGDDGIHANNSALIEGGSIEVVKSNEALEADNITINDGTLLLTATDDGINISGGSAMMPDRMTPETDSAAEEATEEEAETENDTEEIESMLTVNGGFVSVNAEGDGLDSNGSIAMNGGTVLVNGPSQNMNGSLDYDGTLTMEGGVLIAAGSSGMLQAASEESAQPSVVMTFPQTQAAGTLVHIEDSEGNEISTFAPAKEFQAIFISSPDLAVGSSYTLSTGGTSSGEEKEGYYTEGSYEGGTEITDFAIEETVTWLDENGVTEAAAGGMGGGMGGAGFGGTPPEGAAAGGTPPEGRSGGMFGEMDEETKAKMEEIMQQVQEGTITQEEAEAQMAELGLMLPERRADQAE